jgi:hypothetical protein
LDAIQFNLTSTGIVGLFKDIQKKPSINHSNVFSSVMSSYLAMIQEKDVTNRNSYIDQIAKFFKSTDCCSTGAQICVNGKFQNVDSFVTSA